MWSREASLSTTVVRPRAFKPASSAAVDLRGGDRRAVEDRRRIEGAAQRDRAAPALRLLDHLHAHQQQRIEHAPHRPLAQRRVAVEGRGDSVAADHPQIISREPVPALPKSSAARGAEKIAPTPRPPTRQRLADPLDAGAERAAGFARAQHVVAFEQALRWWGSPRLSRPKMKGAMRDRLVAGRGGTRPLSGPLRSALSGWAGGRRGSGHSTDKTLRRCGRLTELGLGS